MDGSIERTVRVPFKLEIPFGQGNLRSLDYCLDVELLGSEDEATSEKTVKLHFRKLNKYQKTTPIPLAHQQARLYIRQAVGATE